MGYARNRTAMQSSKLLLCRSFPTNAGPSSGISRRCWTCWRTGGWMSGRWCRTGLHWRMPSALMRWFVVRSARRGLFWSIPVAIRSGCSVGRFLFGWVSFSGP